jgi:hypothetical protein
MEHRIAGRLQCSKRKKTLLVEVTGKLKLGAMKESDGSLAIEQ